MPSRPYWSVRSAQIHLLRLWVAVRAVWRPAQQTQPSLANSERLPSATPGAPGATPWLDPDRPRAAFLFRVPFELVIDEPTMNQAVVVPMGNQQRPVRIVIAQVESSVLLNDAPARYLCDIRRTDLPQNEPYPAAAWVADVELDNQLEQRLEEWSPEELLFDLALRAFNRYLHAYMIAAEDSSARFLTPQALDPFAIVEFRLLDGSPLDSGLFTLPAAQRGPDLQDKRRLLKRLQHALKAEGQGHPIDDVVLWRVRAEHLINYVGDYELSVLALQTSAERLLYALAAAIAVDKGQDAEAVDSIRRKRFDALTKTLQHDLGGSWDRSQQDQPFGAYWQDLYQLRNHVGHAGRRVQFHEAARGFGAYREFKEFVEHRVLEKVNVFPRTALMLFGLQGLIENGRATHKVLQLDRELQRSGQDWGWWEPPNCGS